MHCFMAVSPSSPAYSARQYVYTQPSKPIGYDASECQILSGVLNLDFSFSYTGFYSKVKLPDCASIPPIADGRIARSIQYLRLVGEIERTSFRI